MNIESIVEDFYNVPNKLRKHKKQTNMENEEHFCANCGEYRVEEVGQHCSKRCDMEFWADMNRDEN